jgi:hypothetical protein
MLRVADVGELTAARERMEASGKSIEALAAESDTRIRQMTMRAEAAASAAAAGLAASAASAAVAPPR